jgi:hypothetical protein
LPRPLVRFPEQSQRSSKDKPSQKQVKRKIAKTLLENRTSCYSVNRLSSFATLFSRSFPGRNGLKPYL